MQNRLVVVANGAQVGGLVLERESVTATLRKLKEVPSVMPLRGVVEINEEAALKR